MAAAAPYLSCQLGRNRNWSPEKIAFKRTCSFQSVPLKALILVLEPYSTGSFAFQSIFIFENSKHKSQRILQSCTSINDISFFLQILHRLVSAAIVIACLYLWIQRQDKMWTKTHSIIQWNKVHIYLFLNRF